MNTFRLYFLLFFSFILATYSCTNDKKSSTTSYFPAQSADTLLVEVGFPFQTKTFEYEGKTFTCFYDLVTYKTVKLYDENFKWVKTFSLDQFADLGLFLNDLEMITPDSVLLLTDYQTNTIISYNAETEKYKLLDLNTLIPFPNIEPSLEFYSSVYSGFEMNQEIYLDVKVSQSAILAHNPGLSPIKTIKLYDSINKTLPFSVQIKKAFSDNPQVNFIKRSFEFKKSFETAYFNSLNLTCLGQKKLIFTSPYLDYFDIYDLATDKTYIKPIRSQFTDISVPLRQWSEIETNLNLLNSNMYVEDLRNAGRVNRIYFDKKNERYHVFVLYSAAVRLKEKEKQKVSPYIWQVYDENFELLDEKEFKPTDLVFGSAIVTKKNIYLPYYNEKTYDPTQAVLLRFAF